MIVVIEDREGAAYVDQVTGWRADRQLKNDSWRRSEQTSLDLRRASASGADNVSHPDSSGAVRHRSGPSKTL
jgi:hypothetical protein